MKSVLPNPFGLACHLCPPGRLPVSTWGLWFVNGFIKGESMSDTLINSLFETQINKTIVKWEKSKTSVQICVESRGSV